MFIGNTGQRMFLIVKRLNDSFRCVLCHIELGSGLRPSKTWGSPFMKEDWADFTIHYRENHPHVWAFIALDSEAKTGWDDNKNLHEHEVSYGRYTKVNLDE